MRADYDEVMATGMVFDVNTEPAPWTGFGDSLRHYQPLVAGIGEDALDQGKGAAALPQYGSDTIAVLNIGGMNDDTQQEAQGIEGIWRFNPLTFLSAS